jgi:DNA repair protein RecO (recombination protein O)
MGLYETEAFVLRTYKLAEADKIVVLLTRRAGLLRGVARGARRLKSKFGASLEPFTHVSLTYHEKEGRELVSISQADIIRSHFHLAGHEYAVPALDYFSELLLEFAPPHEPDEKLFRMVRACLEAIAAKPASVAELTRYFELWLLKLAGFLPDVRRCASCRAPLAGAVTLGTGSQLLCGNCTQGTGLCVSGETQALLSAAMRTAPEEWAHTACAAAAETQQELAHLTRQLITRALERAPRGQRAAS